MKLPALNTIWRATNITLLIIAFFSPWTEGCSGHESLSGTDALVIGLPDAFNYFRNALQGINFQFTIFLIFLTFGILGLTIPLLIIDQLSIIIFGKGRRFEAICLWFAFVPAVLFGFFTLFFTGGPKFGYIFLIAALFSTLFLGLFEIRQKPVNKIPVEYQGTKTIENGSE
jgi:hypothetical protein